MTLAQFREQTAALDGETEILVLTPWGEPEHSEWVSADDLAEDDPVREDFPSNAILLTGVAN